MNKWFKFYGGEYLSDPKMKLLSDSDRSCWLTLLCYASISNVEGEIMYLTEKQLLLDSGVNPLEEQWNKTTGVLERFEKMGMITLGSLGQIIIIHWNDRQNDNAMSGYDRIKRYRERSKVRDDIKKQQEKSFIEFWNEYPRKVGKPKAFEKWCIINPDEELKNKIISAVREQKKMPGWNKDDGQFIPHPTTWLNQCRWDDEVKTSCSKVSNGKFSGIKSIKA